MMDFAALVLGKDLAALLPITIRSFQNFPPSCLSISFLSLSVFALSVFALKVCRGDWLPLSLEVPTLGSVVSSHLPGLFLARNFDGLAYWPHILRQYHYVFLPAFEVVSGDKLPAILSIHLAPLYPIQVSELLS